mmetsp:Transcript_4522/g.6521  ORF Transcript_4522/g.6521 Transcript_4522/m.6521 type:complete len:407 (+) Transcript_4522:76-1296(+)
MSRSLQVTAALGIVASAMAFTPHTSYTNKAGTELKAVTDPTTISKKEYGDICGDVFGEDEMRARYAKQDYIYPKHVEVIKDLEPLAAQMTDEILLDTGDKAWQPQDYLPDMTSDDWVDEVKELRKNADTIPDEILVTLVGDMVTEEALPTYQTLLNTFEGCDDPTGTSESAWAKWSRGWTSEENRHGDLLNKYLYLGGRCDMRSIEVTIQHLITNGFNPDARKDPYRGFIYTSFQERATKISHGNVGRLARESGDPLLSKICAMIAGDEGRHEKAYQKFVTEILVRDPNGVLAVFGDMMRGQIVMPAEQMTDGNDLKLYENFSDVAQRIGVYTAIDYADILEHLIKKWDLEHLEGLNAEGEKERDYLCKLPTRYRKLAERSMNKAKKASDDKPTLKQFSWIQGRSA